MDKSRGQFEAWVKKYHGVSVNEFPSANMVEMFWQAWKASRAALCPKCGATGMADSGGVQPWGEPIEIPCDCPFGDSK